MADEVGVQLALNFSFAEVFDWAVEPVAGVVEQRVDPPEALDRAVDGGVDRGAVGHIAAQQLDPLWSERLDCCAVAFGVAHRGGDAVAAGGQLRRRREAEAARGAGDEDNLILKYHAGSLQSGGDVLCGI